MFKVRSVVWNGQRLSSTSAHLSCDLFIGEQAATKIPTDFEAELWSY
jgi:hypothetical protein